MWSGGGGGGVWGKVGGGGGGAVLLHQYWFTAVLKKSVYPKRKEFAVRGEILQLRYKAKTKQRNKE